ncbi:hypothetical protein LOK46_06050 [Methylobacterium sp. NMS14P]|uniref:hypothetical protein n=1 Tax=Methylobacterium sp. NMS14P TaxID=2894310 RepID=UPI00235A0B34|nr:hypothetical protein [Methylobacterium sp. NMS14P]WCS26395.1 hypothetical protein LOK46_06050 [Methylobacterium sp. NMS14P]
MRSLLLAASLLLLPAPAFALCQCVCVRGEMRPVCQQTDLMVPICQGLCETTIRQERVTTPLAGGRVQFGPAETTNPSPGGLASDQLDLNTNKYGQPLGTPSELSGSVGSSLSGATGGNANSLSGGAAAGGR